MKKRKIKLFASIASLAMVVAVMAVGVWAATTQTLTVSTKASFTAIGVEVQVDAKDGSGVAKATYDKDDTATELSSTAYTILDADLDDDSDLDATATFTLPFVESSSGEDGILGSSDTVIIDYEITTGATACYMTVSWTNPDSATANAVKATATYSYDGGSAAAYTSGTEKSLAASKTAHLIVTYTVQNHNGSSLSADSVSGPSLKFTFTHTSQN